MKELALHIVFNSIISKQGSKELKTVSALR